MNRAKANMPACAILPQRPSALAHLHHSKTGVGEVLAVDGRRSRGSGLRRSLCLHVLHHARGERGRTLINACRFAEPLRVIGLGALHPASLARHSRVVGQKAATRQKQGEQACKKFHSLTPFIATEARV